MPEGEWHGGMAADGGAHVLGSHSTLLRWKGQVERERGSGGAPPTFYSLASNPSLRAVDIRNVLFLLELAINIAEVSSFTICA